MIKKRAFSLVELLLVICIILVLIGTFAAYSQITLRAARETALLNELHNIRMALEFYRITNGGALPEDLTVLTTKRLTENKLSGIKSVNTYLKDFKVDKQGFPLDPFLNTYRYNNEDGRVSSSTRGYESW